MYQTSSAWCGSTPSTSLIGMQQRKAREGGSFRGGPGDGGVVRMDLVANPRVERHNPRRPMSPDAADEPLPQGRRIEKPPVRQVQDLRRLDAELRMGPVEFREPRGGDVGLRDIPT